VSGGEVTPSIARRGRARQIIVMVFAVGLLGFIAWIINEYRISAQQMERGRLMSQMLGALVAYSTEHDTATTQYPPYLAGRFGKDVMARYAWINSKANPASSDIVLIERPELVDGDWCFAALGDSHVKKVRRDEAAAIIRAAGSSITAPTPSP
jgi:hypothetical protein